VPYPTGASRPKAHTFSRAVAVFDSDDRENWRLLTNAYLFVIDTPRFSGANLEFAYPESNRRYLRLSIQNRDDRPIAVSGATLTGVMRSILFRFDSSKEYFVHSSGLKDSIREDDKVTFELEEGKKGLNAVNVKLL